MAPTRRELLTRLGAAAAGLAFSPSVVPACGGGATGISSSPAEPRVAIARDDALLKGKSEDHRVVLEKMLDASLQKLTGEADAARAWSRFFASTDRVGIKVNTLGLSTNPVVVDAIVAGLLKAGLNEERILIWDRFDVELRRAGFVLNRSGVGVQCRGTDAKRVGSGYQQNIEVSGQIGSCYSRIVTEEVDALISVPVLKDHNLAGVSLGMKNFYGAIHNPNKYHDDNCDPYIADVVSHPFIAPKWRLTICDGTRAQFHNGPGKAPGYEWPFAGIFVSGDFVAADAVGADLLESERADKGHKSLAEENRPARHIATAGARGLGESDLTRIEQIRFDEIEEMTNLDNIFRTPSRRDLLRWGAAACGAATVLGRSPTGLSQDVAGAVQLAGPALEGVVRREAMFWEELPDKKVKCVLCPRECEVADVERGYCGVRENQGGRYQTLVYGAVCSANVNPIEKKPLFHYLPSTAAMSIATAGCNMECKFCQNWQISQFRPEQIDSFLLTPERLIEVCKRELAPTIAHTYSEPVVFYEYMHDVAELSRKNGVGNVMISNGYIQEEPLRELCRHITGVKIDLKAFSESFYKEQCNGELAPVLKTLELLKEIGIWFEIVVLVIPTLNDSAEEIREMSRWVVEHLGPDVPMHFSRFHPTYRVTNLPRTPIATVENCRRIAMEAGVHYVYAGNVPMHPGENTYCHHCNETLIERAGYRIINNLIESGKCPQCQTAIPGVWTQDQALAFTPEI